MFLAAERRSKSIISLKKSSDFEKIRNLGKRYHASAWLTVGYLKNEEKTHRFGLTISKKVGNAVLRNKLKRWSRDTFKKSAPLLEPKYFIDLNLVFRPVDKDFYKNLKHKEFTNVLSKAIQNVTKSK